MDASLPGMRPLRNAFWACAGMIVAAGCAGVESPAPVPASVPSQAQPARVDSVIDGDTVWVIAESGGPLAAGERHKIRLLEIDAPELSVSNGQPECGALESSDYLQRRLPEGSTVYLVADREDRDRYDRALRYLWDAQGRFINENAVERGHARAVLFPPNDRFIHVIRQAESKARVSNAGLWGRC